MLLHRKNDSREASSRSLTRCGRARLESAVFLDAEHERRAGEDATQRQLDAGVEGPLLPPCLVEREHARHVRLRHRPTERAARERRDDLRRARLFLAATRRAAGEDALAARRLAGARRIERTGDGQRFDVRPAGRIVGAGGAAKERPQPLRARADLAHERGADRVRTRGHRHAHLQSRIDRVHAVGDARPAAPGPPGRAFSVSPPIVAMKTRAPSIVISI